MKKRTIIILLFLVLGVFFHFGAINAIADFGDFSGSSDYGGGSSGSSSGSSSSSDGGSSSGFTNDPLTIFVFVLVILVFFGIQKLRGAKSSRSRPEGAKTTDVSRLRSISEYLQKDPTFNERELQEKISNLYVQMQNCWTAKNMESLRPYFTDATYAQFDRQLNSYRQNGRTNYVERIAVLGVSLLGWYEQENNDCMVATVRTRIVDYTKDDQTGNIISGSSTAEKFMTYEYVLVRSLSNVTHAQKKDTHTLNCPNCGAPLDINHSAECPYCNSIITAKNYDWVISSIKGISQETR